MRIKTFLFLLLAASPVILGAYTPSIRFFAGYNADMGALSGEPAEADSLLNLGGLVFWRSKMAEKSFFSLAYQGEGFFDFESRVIDDSHYLMTDALIALGPGQLKLSAEARGSYLSDDADNTWYVNSGWEIGYGWNRGRRAVNPSLSYQGGVDWDEESLNRSQNSRVVLGLSYAPSFRWEYRLRGSYGYERWFFEETTALDPEPVDSGIARGDHALGLALEAFGLWGLYWDYRFALEGSLLLSNENRYIIGELLLEEGSENRISLGISGECRWTPKRAVSLVLGMEMGDDYYLDRLALNDDGTAAESALNLFLGEVRLGLDLMLSDGLTLHGEGAGRRTFSGETALDTAEAEFSLWIDYSLPL